MDVITTTTERLKEIMQARNLKQVDILEAARPYCEAFGVHLDKSNISAYINGKYVPAQRKLAVLAMALNVSEAWLMGFDAPMERQQESQSEAEMFLKLFNSLSAENRKRILDLMQALAES